MRALAVFLVTVPTAVVAAMVGCAAFGSADEGPAEPDASAQPEDADAVDSTEADSEAPTVDLDAGVPGCENFALGFEGAQHIEVDDSRDLEGIAPMTVEAWVKLADTSPPEADIFAHYVHPGAGWRLFLGFQGSGPRPHFRFYDGGGTSLLAPTPLSTAWTHLAVVIESGGAARMFVNGRVVERSSSFPAAAKDFNGVLRIGGSNNVADFRFRGLLDEIRITRGVVYADETFDVPRAPLAVSPETIALYNFDEGTGTSAANAAGSAHRARMPLDEKARPRWVAVPCVADFSR